MAEDMEEWISDSNEALSLRLVRSLEDADQLNGDEVQAIEPFSPSFTYPIYGEKEAIFGYKDLEIKLSFASGCLKQLLEINYTDKLESEATPADDIEGLLYNFIPPDYSKSPFAFEQTVQDDSTSFEPLGEKIGSYVRPAASAKGKGKGKAKSNGVADLAEDDDNAVVYEMYKTTWDVPGFREYHRRMQLFILLFIEGGSFVHEDEEAWEFITLFERRKRPNSDICTYHFVRLRLSQFVILPPYQQQGHGSKLYSTLYQSMLRRDDVAELTVEDPAEAFEDLRDRNDLRWLVAEGIMDDPEFLRGIGTGIRGDRGVWENEKRRKYKIAPRQFDRLLEMLLLKQLDKKDLNAVKAYRLHVKARLYRFNYEMLCQMTDQERKDALAKTYESVVEDYERILEMTFGA